MILVTGCAGFIGFHLSLALCSLGNNVVGIDNLNDYYSKELKLRRLEILKSRFIKNFSFENIDLRNTQDIEFLFSKFKIRKVYHLAAQAGVRYSISNPSEYITNNINGFFNLLEACRNAEIKEFIFAGTSGVYGNNSKLPFTESEPAIEPENLYSATKRADELIAFTYANNFDMKILSLRFFTVYGEYGRPDMAIYIFADNILRGSPITLFNKGKHSRSFTYILDLVSIIIKLSSELKTNYNFKVLNIGNPVKTSLLDVVELIGEKLDRDVKVEEFPLQKGDMFNTQCNFDETSRIIGNFNFTSLDSGISKFIDWFKKEGFRYSNK
jgi:UDP-glucuronate 4-epimerase